MAKQDHLFPKLTTRWRHNPTTEALFNLPTAPCSVCNAVDAHQPKRIPVSFTMFTFAYLFTRHIKQTKTDGRQENYETKRFHEAQHEEESLATAGDKFSKKKSKMVR